MVTIENNQNKPQDHSPDIGDFYGRVDDNEIYLVTKHNADGKAKYGLINLSTGFMYSEAKMFIEEIFGNFSDKFYLITKDIKIIIG